MFDEAQTRTEEKTEPHRQRVEAELNLLNEVKPGHHFWMFQITRWVYEFTHQIIKYTKNRDKMFSSDQSRQNVWQKDLVMAADKITDAIDDITHRPNNWSMFELITLCGDYITYCVYLRKRLHHPDMEMPSDDIFVLYGGSMHMMNISELIAATAPTRKIWSNCPLHCAIILCYLCYLFFSETYVPNTPNTMSFYYSEYFQRRGLPSITDT